VLILFTSSSSFPLPVGRKEQLRFDAGHGLLFSFFAQWAGPVLHGRMKGALANVTLSMGKGMDIGKGKGRNKEDTTQTQDSNNTASARSAYLEAKFPHLTKSF
jgi:hypothetical protein